MTRLLPLLACLLALSAATPAAGQNERRAERTPSETNRPETRRVLPVRGAEASGGSYVQQADVLGAGATDATGGGYRNEATLGQALTGTAAGGAYENAAGYWPRAGAEVGGTTYTWFGGTGDWNNEDNWSPSGIPGAGDTAVVNAGFVSIGAGTTIAGFEFNGGHLQGAGDLTVTEAMTWRNGKLRGTTTTRLAAGATLLITGAGGFNVDDDATFINEGEGLWDGAKTLSSNGAGDAQFINEGTLEMAFDAPGGGCSFLDFVNAPSGLLRRTGEGEANVACAFVNDGTFRIEAGAVGLNRAGTDAGAWEVWAGATLRTINGDQTIAASGALTGEGTVDVAGGRLDVDCDATIGTLRLASGSGLGGDGAVTVTDALLWAGGPMRDGGTTIVTADATHSLEANLRLQNTRTLRIESSTAWEGEFDLTLDAGTTLENLATLSSAGPGNRTLSGGGAFVNEGTLVHDGGTLQFNSANFDNAAGTLRLDGGTLNLNSIDTYDGAYEVAAGATLRIINGTCTFPASSSLTGAGTIELTGGRIDAHTDATIGTLVLSATLGGSGLFTVTDALVWDGGAMRNGGTTVVASGATATIGVGGVSLSDTRTFRNEGAITWTGEPDLAINDDATFENLGTLTSTGPGTRSLSAGGTLVNEGLFVHDEGTLRFNGAYLDNTSTVRLDGGAMEINSHNSLFAGLYEIAAGATLRTINGAIAFPASATLAGTGTVDFTGGTVTNAATWAPGLSPGTLAVDSNWPAQTSTLEVEIGGTLPGIEHDVLAVAGTATLGGTLTAALLGGYVPQVGDTFTVLTCGIACNGTFDVPADDTLNVGGVRFHIVYNPMDVTLETVSAAPVSVAAQPVDPPVQIPSSGGAFDFRVVLTNNTGEQQSFQGWTDVLLPNGAPYGPALGPRNVTIGPNGTIGPLTFRQQVPRVAPAGTYLYRVRLGTFPDEVYSEATFPFEKAAGVLARQAARGQVAGRAADGRGTVAAAEEATTWAVEQVGGPPLALAEREVGEDEARAREGSGAERDGGATAESGPAASSEALPEAFALYAARPNPTASRTTLRYDLPEAGCVRLAVYDLLGREVAVLADGEQASGSHEAVLDARALPAGTYLVRMTAEGGFHQTQRVTRVR